MFFVVIVSTLFVCMYVYNIYIHTNTPIKMKRKQPLKMKRKHQIWSLIWVWCWPYRDEFVARLAHLEIKTISWNRVCVYQDCQIVRSRHACVYKNWRRRGGLGGGHTIIFNMWGSRSSLGFMDSNTSWLLLELVQSIADWVTHAPSQKTENRCQHITILNVNLSCLKSSNVHTNTFHASDRPIL